MKRILITGALGQIGSELTVYLRKMYGDAAVLATDVAFRECDASLSGPFRTLDVTDGAALFAAAKDHRADAIFHLAALLSARAETKPLAAWQLNVGGLLNALETARELGAQLFVPSSIAVFGKGVAARDVPQMSPQRPGTIYGISKAAGELLCDYYFLKYGVDARGLRLPGIISHAAPPGGGTTDYAVEMYREAVRCGAYTSYIAAGTFLDMMYMPDALKAMVQLMEADAARLVHRNAYNVSAMSADPEAFAASIRRRITHFRLDYRVDPERQAIAESWPDSLDTSAAREEWGFAPEYDLDRMTDDMLHHLAIRLGNADAKRQAQ